MTSTLDHQPITETVIRSIRPTRTGNSIFIPLPPELWRKCNGCDCPTCKSDGTGGYWDTLAVESKPGADRSKDMTWTVHHPTLHPAADRRRMKY
jgi:hypothetical protein